jgi:acetyl/propionyl-CoA carboxylase alpha subunit/predicted Fe-Mo cluster-binding NifX family protein
LERYRDHRDKSDDPSIQTFARALGHLRDHPEAARLALIGCEGLSALHLDEIYRAVRPQGQEILTNPNIKRVFVPNRGEIALRIVRGLIAEGCTPIVTYSDSDAKQSFVRRAREMGAEVVAIGGNTAKESYLRQDLLLEVAREHGADAIHPGYGFLSENADFAQMANAAGLVWMGPSVASMRAAGGKASSKLAFQAAGVPVVPGTAAHRNVEDLIREITEKKIPGPWRLKADDGGSGMGQDNAFTLDEIRAKFSRLSAEAQSAFGNPAIMAEVFVPSFLHIEFQIMGDRFGNIIHLGERECTLQKGGAKLVEIHPAAIFDQIPGLRERMQEAAVLAARAVNYTGVGTVEFMLNRKIVDFSALEVNARIQVEHRVTELVTGVDLIREQVRVSRGLPLSVSQSDISPKGAAVEIRIGASGVGQITEFSVMGTPDFSTLESQGIFVEATYVEGDTPNPHVNKLLAKFITTGEDRADAIRKMRKVASQTKLRGNRPFDSELGLLRSLVETDMVLEATYDNGSVGEWLRAGGEDFSRYPHRESTLLRLGSQFIHFEVGDREAVDLSVVERYAQAFRSLLSGERATEGEALTGPIARLLESKAEIREDLQSEEESRRMWVQTDARGNLRQLAVFQNYRPHRVLRATDGPIGTGQKVENLPLVYDLRFTADGTQIAGAELAALLASGELHSHLTVRPGNEYFVPADEDQPARLFRTATGSNPLAIDVRLIPVGLQRGLEIRNRRNNILVSLAPEQLMETPAQRLLSLFELAGSQALPHILRRAQTQIQQIVRSMAEAPHGSSARQQFLEEIGCARVSLVGRLLELYRQSGNPAERQLLDEAMARREVSGYARRHRFVSYQPVDQNISVVQFEQRPTNGMETGPGMPRLMVRVHGDTGLPMDRVVQRAMDCLQEQIGHYSGSRSNVIQIIDHRFEPRHLNDVVETFNLGVGVQRMLGRAFSAAQAIGEHFPLPRRRSKRKRRGDPEHLVLRRERQDHRLKRLTVVIDQPGAYPGSATFRRAKDEAERRTGPWAEDTRFRNLHPMLAHILEFWRWQNFDMEHDLTHSSRSSHVFLARNRKTPELKAGEDQRLVGMGLIPEAEVLRSGESLEIPLVEGALVDVMQAMHHSLDALPKKDKPYWNRLALNIQPVLSISDAEVVAYAETLAERHGASLGGLGLEKVVVKGDISDPRHPDGFRTILIRVNNPTGYRFEPTLDTIVRARVYQADGSVAEREVLIRNGVYERWLEARQAQDDGYVIPHGEWAVADEPIRPATGVEIREQQSRSRGMTFAYRVPELYDQVAENFRVALGLQAPRDAVQETLRPPPFQEPTFVELDLDPQSLRYQEIDGQQRLDPNYGELSVALDAQGRPRPIGENQAAIVIGLHSMDLGIGQPVRRLLMMGDLTHLSGGSLSQEECTRINAAIRYAQRERIGIDGIPASKGAKIDRKEGVEVLEATTTTLRDIIYNATQDAKHHGKFVVPMNFIVDDYNVGAMSYWISVAAIIEESGGYLIMTSSGTPERPAGGSTLLTGPVALIAALFPTLNVKQRADMVRKYFPKGLQDIAGYRFIHGPNGEAVAAAPNLREGLGLLTRLHYFTYAPNGELVGRRPLGADDPVDRDITGEPAREGRSIGDEIEAWRKGNPRANLRAVLEAYRDRGSPEPVFLWQDYVHPLGEANQSVPGETESQASNSVVALLQRGGRPALVIAKVGGVSPADSFKMAMAVAKAGDRLPVDDMGTLFGFGSWGPSMRRRQLTYGARYGRAKVVRRGPYVEVNTGASLGGIKVVRSKQLRLPEDQAEHRVIALQGAREQVIGGSPAESVVYIKENEAEARQDPRVIADPREYESVLKEIIARRAAEFDAYHNDQRALRTGAVNEIFTPDQFRPAIIRHSELAIAAYEARLERQRLALEAETERQGTRALASRPAEQGVQTLIEGFRQFHGEADEVRAKARAWSESLRRFAEGDDQGQGSDPDDGNGGSVP